MSQAKVTRTSQIMDAHGLTVALLKVAQTPKGFEVAIAWLPELFMVDLPDSLRAALVRHLRMHADKLESGETERAMQPHLGTNLKNETQS